MSTEINREEWRIRRLTKKITLKEIAHAIGCTYPLISGFESENNNMAEDKIEGYMKYIAENDNRKK